MNDVEKRYVITPKGIAYLCLREVGLLDNDKEGQFTAFWILFEQSMKDNGYIVEK